MLLVHLSVCVCVCVRVSGNCCNSEQSVRNSCRSAVKEFLQGEFSATCCWLGGGGAGEGPGDD